VSTVAVVTSSPPFVEGGHLVIARALVTALREAGHAADVVLTPQNRFGRQAAAYAATWLTDVGQTADGRTVDQVISLRFPSYAVRHPRHVCWLNHTMREYYDLWPAFRAQLSSVNQKKEGIRRRMIHRAPDVTRMLDRLVRQSVVARVRNPDDRRESIATITRAGLALLERVDPDLQRAQAELTSPLSEAELRRLSRLCDALVP